MDVGSGGRSLGGEWILGQDRSVNRAARIDTSAVTACDTGWKRGQVGEEDRSITLVCDASIGEQPNERGQNIIKKRWSVSH